MLHGNNDASKRASKNLKSSPIKKEQSSEVFLLEEWKKDCSDQQGCLQIINSHLPFLIDALKNDELKLLVLEILSMLTAFPSNRPVISSQPGLMDQIEKLRVGSLSQKKLADLVHERLLECFLMTHASEIGVSLVSTDTTPVSTPEKKHSHSKKGKIVSRPVKHDAGKENAAKSEKPVQSAVTVNLFVENMDEKVLTELETCLLKTKGVVSFFSDVEEGKISVRLTSENITSDVIGYIYEVTKRRTSVIQGDYDSSGFPLYHTDANQKKNDGFFSALYQIVSVSEVHNHPREKPKSGGWLGSWW